MAGEILSLAPIIAEFHDKEAEITYGKLLGHPRPEEREEAVVTVSSTA